MKFTEVEHLSDFQEAFLEHMRIDIREKIKETRVYIIVSKEDIQGVVKEAILMHDRDSVCRKAELFHGIEFELLENVDQYDKDWFKDRNVCSVV